MQSQYIGISWQLSDRHGWGVFGYNLALNLIRNGPCPPLLLSTPNFIGIPEQTANKIQSYLWNFKNSPEKLQSTTLLHSLGNEFQENPATRQMRGRHNIAFAFFEETGFSSAALARAASWDHLLVGSSWNRTVCLDRGITNVTFVSQGVDTSQFAPAPRQGVPSGRFVIYSGGKLEYRKGQDLVVAAFRVFHEKYPDSLLLTAWQNNWSQSAASIARSPLVTGGPEAGPNGQLLVADWAVGQGIARDAFVDLGWISNQRLPAILNEADVALFPSRCEGGTNLAAMEAMACGVPCLLSANTGHLDIIDGDTNCYPLTRQSPCGSGATADWRDSDVDEIVDTLERAYHNSAARRQIGRQGELFMGKRSWAQQTRQLVGHIQPFL
ncbi:MAG: glycosyltransferase family 4 protein [Rhodospirillales bacterium]|nr:glycosyltransferase family 4 protein [Rhodospirillales bacterium]